MQYKLSKNEWLAIGKKTGWLKKASYDPLDEQEDFDEEEFKRLVLKAAHNEHDWEKRTPLSEFMEKLNTLSSFRKMYAYVSSFEMDYCVRGKAQIGKFEISCNALNDIKRGLEYTVKQLKYTVETATQIVDALIENEDFMIETRGMEWMMEHGLKQRSDWLNEQVRANTAISDQGYGNPHNISADRLRYFIQKIYNARRSQGSIEHSESKGKVIDMKTELPGIGMDFKPSMIESKPKAIENKGIK